jgi:hypothetical protein
MGRSETPLLGIPRRSESKNIVCNLSYEVSDALMPSRQKERIYSKLDSLGSGDGRPSDEAVIYAPLFVSPADRR